jgi:hypothetical protein
MEQDPMQIITLNFLRTDGQVETTSLFYYSLEKARSIADSVFRDTGDSRYLEVEIRMDNGYSEILSNLYPTVEDLQRI